ncbi:MAG: hypothetical protein MUF04_08050 [Akkermansiaceae bacterium]|nr:hypothetical protein [Akkermansiaceae bacterium]
MVAVNDLDGPGEAILPHFLQTKRPIDQQHDLIRSAHAAAQSPAPQADPEVLRGDVGHLFDAIGI